MHFLKENRKIFMERASLNGMEDRLAACLERAEPWIRGSPPASCRPAVQSRRIAHKRNGLPRRGRESLDSNRFSER